MSIYLRVLLLTEDLLKLTDTRKNEYGNPVRPRFSLFFVCSEVRCQANRLDSSFPRSKQVQESVWHLPRQRHPGGSRVEVGREIKREFVYSLVISLVISLGGAA